MTTDARKAALLWGLLDDIDTLDDACRDDDAEFRNRVRRIQQLRFKVMSGEEFEKARELDNDDGAYMHSAAIGEGM